jgi:RNA polymerase sigma-70 factor (ECF subfamily)
MSAAINGALHTYGSNLSFLPAVKNTHRRNRPASHAVHRLSFDELALPHVQKILRVVHRITRNREDAEDAMQDAFLQALAHFQDFDGRSAFATWLTRIAINSSLMILRKRRNAKAVSLNDGNDSEESTVIREVRDPVSDVEEQFLQKERETALREAIQMLRPSLRKVVELAQLGERSIRETAEMLDLSVSAAKARLFHARRSLKKAQTLQRFRKPVTRRR